MKKVLWALKNRKKNMDCNRGEREYALFIFFERGFVWQKKNLSFKEI